MYISITLPPGSPALGAPALDDGPADVPVLVECFFGALTEHGISISSRSHQPLNVRTPAEVYHDGSLTHRGSGPGRPLAGRPPLGKCCFIFAETV